MNIPELVATFEARSLRERVLITLTVLAVTWGLWIASVGGYVIDTKEEVITDISRLSQMLQAEDAERRRLQLLDTGPAKIRLEERRDQLERMVAAQHGQLEGLLDAFIPPEEVPQLLRDMLRSHSGLQLKQLASHESEPLIWRGPSELQTRQASVADETLAEADEDSLQIYRHPITIELSGRYGDVYDYLTALESTGWRFSWRALNYEVASYPQARVVIEIETLSRERDWLGV